MEQNFRSEYSNILASLKEQYGKVVYTYTTHLKEARYQAKLNSFFLWTDIILSAITTGGLLGVIITKKNLYEVISCAAAVILLVISLYTKEARLAEKAVAHKEFANKLWNVRESYLALMTDASRCEYEMIAKQRDELQKKLAELYRHEPLTSVHSYRKAKKALNTEEEQFFTKAELNKILPKYLREE